MAGSFPVLLGAVVVDSTNKSIRMTENGVTQTVTLAEGTYYLHANGDSGDLTAALVTALNSHTGGTNTYGVGVTFSVDPSSPSAAVAIVGSGQAFALLWADALTTFDPGWLGFTEVNTANDAATKSSTLSPSCIWIGNDIYRALEPTPAYQRILVRARSGKVRAVNRSTAHRDRLWSQENIHAYRMHEEEITTDPTRAFSRFVERHADGTPFRFYDGTISSGTTLSNLSTTEIGTFHFSDDFYPSGGGFATREDGAPLYSFDGMLMPYVA